MLQLVFMKGVHHALSPLWQVEEVLVVIVAAGVIVAGEHFAVCPLLQSQLLVDLLVAFLYFKYLRW